jgi:hypothetical protein
LISTKTRKETKESIKILLDYDYDTVLVGDGEPVLENGKEAIKRFLDRRDVHLKLARQTVKLTNFF